jgi:3'-phosphoadenosine 5'-phosphosulfate sulfotransferase (PAPS reductase)/FAD synthetase
MRLYECENPNQFKLTDCAKIACTNGFKQKINDALKIIEYFLSITKNSAVSFGGGKDGTAVLILAQMIDPKIRVVCADPPNPLPDRDTHINNCIETLNLNIDRIKYDWNVNAVLDGSQKYPDGLKMRMLSDYQKRNNIDGIIWGCRNAESRARQYNFAKNGYVYQVADGTYRCQPIAKWTAEEALALALVTGYPINPVYEKMDGIYDLNSLHDGTWWPHGVGDEKQWWIKKYYPDYYDSYLQAVRVDTGKFIPCEF